MKNNLKRKIAVTATGCLAFACISAGGVALASAKEMEDPVFSMENNGAFYMVEGAGVKLYQGSLAGIDGNAMRFIFEMSQDQYGNMIENGEYKDGVSVKSYVIAEDMIDEGLTTAQQIVGDSNVVETEIPANKWVQGTSNVKGSSATVYYACAYVYNLPKEYYDDNVSAFAVLTTGTDAMYTTVQSRSMSYVADVALESGEYEANKTTLEGYLTDKFVWLKNANSEKIATDFEDTDSAYQKLVSGKTYTYFANSTIGATNATTGTKAAKIVTETVGDVEGTYATLNVDSGAFRPIWLQPTMTTTEMQKYYDLGYTLKLKVYISTDATVRGLHYDRTDPANPKKSSGMAAADAYADKNDEYTVTKNTWTEITIDFADYIYDCQVNNTDGGAIGEQITKDDEQLRGTIWVKGASYGPTIYMSEMYLQAPTENLTATKGMTVDFERYIPTEGEYEYYKVEDGVYTELKATSVVAGKNDFKIAIVKVDNKERTVAKFVDVRVESSDEWLATLNESISGTKVVTDYTKGAYQEIYTGTKTYFGRAHDTWQYNSATVVNEEVGGVLNNYAKVELKKQSSSYGSNINFNLLNTMSLEDLKSYASKGYTLKLPVYIDANGASSSRNVYILEYDRTQETPTLKTIKNSGRKTTVITDKWDEIEIDIIDYILMMENLDASIADGRPYYSKQMSNASAVIAINMIYQTTQADSWSAYFGAMYLEAPTGDEKVTAAENDSLTVSDYKPTEEGTYEYYKFESGVYTAIEETTVSVGANDFQIAVVKVEIVDGNVERTFVNRVDVTVQTETTA